jgi:ABC-type multidrug transport system permease subunit
LAVSFPKTPKDLRKLSFFNTQYKKRIGNFIDQEHA